MKKWWKLIRTLPEKAYKWALVLACIWIARHEKALKSFKKCKMFVQNLISPIKYVIMRLTTLPALSETTEEKDETRHNECTFLDTDHCFSCMVSLLQETGFLLNRKIIIRKIKEPGLAKRINTCPLFHFPHPPTTHLKRKNLKIKELNHILIR